MAVTPEQSDHTENCKIRLAISNLDVVMLSEWVDSGEKCCVGDTGDLVRAAANGDLVEVLRLIGEGMDLEAPNWRGQTALPQAVIEGHTEVCRALVAAGAPVEVKNESVLPPLYMAARKGFYDICILLIGAGAEVDVKDENGATAMCMAALGGHASICDALAEAGANVDGLGESSDSPLVLAAKRGEWPTCEALLEAGADANLAQNGLSPLRAAATRGHYRCCSVLLEWGAAVDDVKLFSSFDTSERYCAGWIPLFAAGSARGCIISPSEHPLGEMVGKLMQCKTTKSVGGLERAGSSNRTLLACMRHWVCGESAGIVLARKQAHPLFL